MISDNTPPDGYPTFEDGGLHENLLLDENIYIVDRTGKVCITTTSNKRWQNCSEGVRELNEGFIRARYLSNLGDFLTYTNQIRLATPEEVKTTQKWVNFRQNAYILQKNGQFSLF